MIHNKTSITQDAVTQKIMRHERARVSSSGTLAPLYPYPFSFHDPSSTSVNKRRVGSLLGILLENDLPF
jgi:hypothetical protein